MLNSVRLHARDQYNIDFTQIDNPVEVLLLPIMRPGTLNEIGDVGKLCLDSNLKADGDSFELISQRDAIKANYGRHRIGESMADRIRRRARAQRKAPKPPTDITFIHAGRESKLTGEFFQESHIEKCDTTSRDSFYVEVTNHGIKLNGTINESPVVLTIIEEGQGTRCKGTIGSIKVDSKAYKNFAGVLDPNTPVFIAEGTIGGLEYQETIYQKDSTTIGTGKLGDMKIKTQGNYYYDENNQGFLTGEIKGQIGKTKYNQKTVDKTNGHGIEVLK